MIEIPIHVLAKLVAAPPPAPRARGWSMFWPSWWRPPPPPAPRARGCEGAHLVMVGGFHHSGTTLMQVELLELWQRANPMPSEQVLDAKRLCVLARHCT